MSKFLNNHKNIIYKRLINKDLNRHLTKEDIQMTNMYIKILHIICLQGNKKWTMRFHYTPIKMAKILNAGDTTFWGGCSATEISFLSGGITGTFESSFTLSYKTNRIFPYNPATVLHGIYSKELQNVDPHENLHMGV